MGNYLCISNKNRTFACKKTLYVPSIMRKILILPDSFKGSLSQQAVAQAIAAGARAALGEACELVMLPASDGGEGMVSVLAEPLGAEMVELTVCDPLFRPQLAHYAIAEIAGRRTAIMEMAEASGLILLPVWIRHPIATSTFGTGELLLDALNRGCTDILLGIGGSATNDGGMGMLTALGWRFLDHNGEELAGVGGNLDKIAQIDDSAVDEAVKNLHIRVACDVQTPFCGPDGATRVFAPQKGADEETVEVLENGMQHFADMITKRFHLPDFSTIAGGGAAGGLGGALMAFLGAELLPGAEVVLDALQMDVHLRGADLVITGEGKIDKQTLTGKVPYAVLQHAKRQGVPTLVIAGAVEDAERLKEAGFMAIRNINEGNTIPPSEWMQPEVARKQIQRTIELFIKHEG